MPGARHYRYRNYKFRPITVINDAYMLEFAIELPGFAFIRSNALSTSDVPYYILNYGRCVSMNTMIIEPPFVSEITANTCISYQIRIQFCLFEN